MRRGRSASVFDGATGAGTIASPLGDFFRYPPGFVGGAFVGGGQ